MFITDVTTGATDGYFGGWENLPAETQAAIIRAATESVKSDAVRTQP